MKITNTHIVHVTYKTIWEGENHLVKVYEMSDGTYVQETPGEHSYYLRTISAERFLELCGNPLPKPKK